MLHAILHCRCLLCHPLQMHIQVPCILTHMGCQAMFLPLMQMPCRLLVPLHALQMCPFSGIWIHGCQFVHVHYDGSCQSCGSHCPCYKFCVNPHQCACWIPCHVHSSHLLQKTVNLVPISGSVPPPGGPARGPPSGTAGHPWSLTYPSAPSSTPSCPGLPVKNP